MLPLSASGVGFRLKPEVDYCLSQWEALLLLGFGLLSRDYSSLSEDYLVSVALELFAEKYRIKSDLVCRNLHDAKSVEEVLAAFAELLDERVVRSPVVEGAARVACDMACDEVDVFLFKGIEGDTVQQDAPFLAVFALHARLLRGAVGVAVEQAYAARQQFCRIVFCIGTPVFDHVRIGELASIVSEDDAEQLLEQV